MTNSSTKAIEDEARAAAEHAFRLAKAGEDGVSVEAKAHHIWETTGRRPAVLDGPEMPPEAERAWVWFLDLHQGRQSGFSVSPIAWSDVHAYLTLHQIQHTSLELRLLRIIDTEFLKTTTPTEDTNGRPGDPQHPGGHAGDEAGPA